MTRDVAFEQITGSTMGELALRQHELKERAEKRGGLPWDRLRELHLVESELYCRINGIKSEPGVMHVPTVKYRVGQRIRFRDDEAPHAEHSAIITRVNAPAKFYEVRADDIPGDEPSIHEDLIVGVIR